MLNACKHLPPFSAIREDARELDHQISSNNFEIIARLKTQLDTFIADKIVIDSLKPEWNRINQIFFNNFNVS